jgi:hypothetical protein
MAAGVESMAPATNAAPHRARAPYTAHMPGCILTLHLDPSEQPMRGEGFTAYALNRGSQLFDP